jgi:hypothetical protein
VWIRNCCLKVIVDTIFDEILGRPRFPGVTPRGMKKQAVDLGEPKIFEIID